MITLTVLKKHPHSSRAKWWRSLLGEPLSERLVIDALLGWQAMQTGYHPTILSPYVPGRCWFGIRDKSLQRYCGKTTASFYQVTKGWIDVRMWLCGDHANIMKGHGYQVTIVLVPKSIDNDHQ